MCLVSHVMTLSTHRCVLIGITTFKDASYEMNRKSVWPTQECVYYVISLWRNNEGQAKILKVFRLWKSYYLIAEIKENHHDDSPARKHLALRSSASHSPPWLGLKGSMLPLEVFRRPFWKLLTERCSSSSEPYTLEPSIQWVNWFSCWKKKVKNLVMKNSSILVNSVPTIQYFIRYSTPLEKKKKSMIF